MAHVTDDNLPQTATPSTPPGAAVGGRWLLGFVVANFGMQIALQTPSTFLIPQQIAAIDPQGKVTAYAWASALGAVAGLFAAPLAGALSDRTTGRFGRRRPWMLGGAAASMAVLLETGLATTVWAVSLGALLLSAAMCALGAGLNTVVPDQVPVGERGRVLGWAAVPQAAGLALGGVLVGIAPGNLAGYLVLAAALLLVLPFARSTPDRPLAPAERQPLSWSLLLDGWRIDPRRTPTSPGRWRPGSSCSSATAWAPSTSPTSSATWCTARGICCWWWRSTRARWSRWPWSADGCRTAWGGAGRWSRWARC
ncbi:MFS transporter [Streptacidiphilus sp. 4-A2]|nr:MFS transporter [Streptacidiphilus sp. 4-A2]